MRFGTLMSAITLGLCFAPPVKAQEADQTRISCGNEGGDIPRDIQIADCTALIDSGSETAENLSLAYYNRGSAYYALSLYPSAIDDYGEVIRINPEFPAAFYSRGRLYSELRDHQTAVADYDEAIRLNPKNADYLYWRCWARAVWGEQLAEALADCDQALKLAPNAATTLNARGMVHIKRGDWAKALADYDTASKLQVNYASALYGRGIARVQLGQVNDGEADLALAVAIDPDIAATYGSYGLVL